MLNGTTPEIQHRTSITQLIFINRVVVIPQYFINSNQSGFYHSSWIYSSLVSYWLVQIEMFIASETLWSNSQICKGRKNTWILNSINGFFFSYFLSAAYPYFDTAIFGFNSIVWYYVFFYWADMFLRKTNSEFSRNVWLIREQLQIRKQELLWLVKKFVKTFFYLVRDIKLPNNQSCLS